jgi:hypothetical protein
VSWGRNHILTLGPKLLSVLCSLPVILRAAPQETACQSRCLPSPGWKPNSRSLCLNRGCKSAFLWGRLEY